MLFCKHIEYIHLNVVGCMFLYMYKDIMLLAERVYSYVQGLPCMWYARLLQYNYTSLVTNQISLYHI